ncbi:MAG: hypothetical protein QG670_980 [Thermoproteota archaeon]|nr:hypothetical protein [Thermoproteota archaeon]
MTNAKYSNYKSQEVEAFMMNILEKTPNVKPVFDLNLGYRYPDVEKTVNKTVNETSDFLEHLVNAEVLDREIFDMELRCPSCNSPNVSVNYVCPKCTSSNIKKTILVEHSKCGYLGTLISFGEVLTCPKCGEQLLEGNYRNAGSIYECGSCQHQIETPFINHWCRGCGTKFSFENAVYQQRFAYLPSKSTSVEMSQGILYPSLVLSLFEEQGFSREMESKVTGESGAVHSFDLAFKGYGLNFLVDVYFSLDPISELDFLRYCGKITDAKASNQNIDILLIILPSLTSEAEAISKTFNLSLIIGEKSTIVISKLRTILSEKATALKALSALETETIAETSEINKEPESQNGIKKKFTILRGIKRK